MESNYQKLTNTENVFLGLEQLHSHFRVKAPKVGTTYSSPDGSWEVTYMYTATSDTPVDIPLSQPGVLQCIRNAHYPDEYISEHVGGPYSVPLRTVKHTNNMSTTSDGDPTVYVQYRKRIVTPPCGLSWRGLWPLSLFMPAVTVRKEYAVFTRVNAVSA